MSTASWPGHGLTNWDGQLKEYIDTGDASGGTVVGGGGLLSVAGGAPVAFADNFARTDRDLGGDVAPTGQTYTRGGSDAVVINNGRADFAAVQTGVADIIYADCGQKPAAIASEFALISGAVPDPPDYEYDMVIGAAAVGFGSGSIQLSITNRGWQVFVVTNPIVDPYPVLAQGTFDTPLNEGAGILHQAALHYDEANSAVTVKLPTQSSDGAADVPGSDGNLAVVDWWGDGGTIAHADINTYWGQKFGFQCRRQGGATAGYVQFAAVEARTLTVAGGSGGSTGEVMQSSVAPVTVSNTAITTLMYAFEPTGGQVAGQTVYRLRASGRFDSIAAGGSFDIQIRGKKGPTDSGAPLYATLPISPGLTAAASGLVWWFDIDIYVDATDPGTISVFGLDVSFNNGAGYVNRAIRQVGTASDLSTGMEVAIDVKMATANAGNVMYLDRAVFEQIA